MTKNMTDKDRNNDYKAKTMASEQQLAHRELLFNLFFEKPDQ